MVILVLIIGIIASIICLPHIFTTYTNMEYIKYLEDMGVFVDENGREI